MAAAAAISLTSRRFRLRELQVDGIDAQLTVGYLFAGHLPRSSGADIDIIELLSVPIALVGATGRSPSDARAAARRWRRLNVKRTCAGRSCRGLLEGHRRSRQPRGREQQDFARGCLRETRSTRPHYRPGEEFAHGLRIGDVVAAATERRGRGLM